MAITVAELNARITADTSGFEKGVQSSHRKIEDFGSKLKSVGQDISIFITAPLVLLAKKVFDVGSSYETAMNVFQATTKATTVQMSLAAAAAEKLGADMSLPATSAADAAIAMTELAKGGLNASQAMDAARGTLQLAAAATIGAGEAAGITANALNAFGLAASEAGKVSDLLAAAANASSAEIGDVAAALQQSAAGAHALKVPIDDLVTAIGEMANAGIKGSDAGTSLKTMMIALNPHTDKAAKAMKQLGIDAFDATGHFVGFEAIIKQAAPALASMTDQQKQAAIQTAFGTDAQRAANIILSEGAEKWGEMHAQVTLAGAAQDLAAAKAKGLAGAFAGLTSQLETIAINIYKDLSPGIENIVRKIADLTGSLSNLDPQIVEMGATFAGVLAVGGPVLLGLGKLASIIASLGPEGAIMAGALAAVATLSAAYVSDFGEMQKAVDDFGLRITRVLGDVEASEQGVGYSTKQFGLDMVGVFDYVITGISKWVVAITQGAEAAAEVLRGNLTGAIAIVRQERSEIANIEVEYQNRKMARDVAFAKDIIGQMATNFNAQAEVAKKGGAQVAEGYTTSFSATLHANPPAAGLLQSFQSQIPMLSAAAREMGLKSGTAALQGWRSGIEQHSPSGFEKDLDRITKAFIEFPEKIRSQVLPHLKNHAKQMLKDWRESFNEMLGVVNQWSSAVGPGLNFTAEILADMSKGAREWAIRTSQAFKETQDASKRFAIALAADLAAVKSGLRVITETIDGEFRVKIVTAAGSVEKSLDGVIRAGKGVVVTGSEINEKWAGVGLLWSVTGQAMKQSAENVDTSFKKLSDTFKDLSNKLPESWNSIIDGILNGSGRMGEDLLKVGIKVKDWAGGVLGIVNTMPGKFGEAARGILKTADTWIKFADSVLASMNKLNRDIPATLGELVVSMGQMFKKIFKSANDAQKQGESESEDGASKWAARITGIINGAVMYMSTRHQGLAKGILGGAMAGMTAGAAFGPIGAAVGGIGGAIAGIFGSGKSAEQKRQEEEAKKAAEINTASAIANLNQGIIDGLERGRQLLEGLATFVAVPKQALKKFFQQLQTLLTNFVDMASTFKSEGIAKAKEVSEMMGPVFEFLGNAVNFTKLAREIEDVSDESIAKLMSAISRLEAGFEKVIEKLELSVVKRSARMAEKLTKVFEFVQIIPDALKKVNETPEVSDAILTAIFASATRVIDRFAQLIDQFEAYSFNKLAKSSKQFQGVFEAVSAIVGSLKAIGDYQPFAEGVLDSVTGDLQQVLTALGTWLDLGNAALEKSLSWEDVMRRLQESMSRGMSSLASLTQASTSGSSSSLRTQTTNIDQSMHFAGVTIAPGQPGYEELSAAVRAIQATLGGVQQVRRAY